MPVTCYWGDQAQGTLEAFAAWSARSGGALGL